MECTMLSDRFSQRSTDKEAEKIREMIEKEPSEIERKRLQVTQYLLDQAAAQMRYTLEVERNHTIKFAAYEEDYNKHKEDTEQKLKDHAEKLGEHEKLVIEGRTTWKHIIAVSLILLSGFGYAYKVIDNLRMSVRSLEDRSNLFNESSERDSFAKSVKKSLMQIESAIVDQNIKIEDIELRMKHILADNAIIMEKRAFREMK